MRDPSPVVIGVDIGTTSTKVVAFDGDGQCRAKSEQGYPLEEPQPGYAVQNPALVLDAVTATLGVAAAEVHSQGIEVAGVSFSSAMHSLIALDDAGSPLTPSITWADIRAAEVAERLRESAAGRDLHRHTGTPIHPMAPLSKLVWFHEHDPAVVAAARCWVGVKEYVLAQLTGEYVMDRSIASATGLFDLETATWWPPALAVAGISTNQLPSLVSTTHLLRMTAGVEGQLGLAGVPLIVGAGDGPLANLGVGAIRPGVAACSIGTSGAVRVIVENPGVDPLGRVFCYELTEQRWAVGGAISNGGSVLEWVGQALAPELPARDKEELMAIAAEAPAGCDGLLMLPYLMSERAPHWSALARGAYIGLTSRHRRPHLIRAALEGVCQQLALVLEAVRRAGYEVREIRATGGFLRNQFSQHLLTDVLGSDVGRTAETDGSAFGAALLGMYGLGLIDSLEVAADLVPVVETIRPDNAAAAIYQQQRVLFDRLFDALTPTYRALHQMERPATPGGGGTRT
jgi:gluconokinase